MSEYPPVEKVLREVAPRRVTPQRVDTIAGNVAKIVSGETKALGIEGVPGAGKTTLFASSVASVLADALCGGRVGRDLVIYIAPTNALVLEFLTKLYSFLSSMGCTMNDFLRRVRAYGSKIYSVDYPEVLKPVDDNVALVASTEWQRVSARIVGRERSAVLLVDEASRMTVSRFFIPIADSLARGKGRKEGRLEFRGLVVIGDENQAIGLSEVERTYLLLQRLKEISYRDRDNYVEMRQLRHSYRLPPPTEIPLNEGYYKDLKIEALGTPLEAFIKTIDAMEVEKVFRVIERSGIVKDDRNRKAVLEALNILFVEKRPRVHIELYEFGGADTYELDRTRLAAASAYGVGELAKSLDINVNVAVVSPYARQSYSPVALLKLLNLGVAGLRYGTVTSYIGREDGVVVAVMGKERDKAFYLRDPYQFSVQLSRHSNALVTIGCAECLVNAAEYQLRRRLRRRPPREYLAALEKMRDTAQALLGDDRYVIRVRQ